MSSREKLRRRREATAARQLVAVPATLRRIRYLIETGRADRLEPEGLTITAQQWQARGGDFPVAGFLEQAHPETRRPRYRRKEP